MATGTNEDDGEKSTDTRIVDRRSDDYGSRRSQLPGIKAATMSVELPDHFAAEDVSVSGYAYDDEPGEVQLSIGGGVQVGVWIDSDGARELAEQLRIAAAEADEQIGDET